MFYHTHTKIRKSIKVKYCRKLAILHRKKLEEKELKQRQKEKYYMFDSNSINIDEVLIQAEKKGNK